MTKARSVQNSIGKRVGSAIYVHRSAIYLLNDVSKKNAAQAQAKLQEDFQWSVLKIAGRGGQAISFLDYDDFATVAFPELKESYFVDLTEGILKRRQYSSLNPPILHRKELLLAPDNPLREQFAKVTEILEANGLFKNMATMGTRKPWLEALKNAGLSVDGAMVVQLAEKPNETQESEVSVSRVPKAIRVDRHKTAIPRAALSAPMYLLFTNGLITPNTTVLDYGCGQGDDVKALRAAGYQAEGWDPHYRPDPAFLKKSQITNLGFVLNVIENPDERVEALRRSFSLTQTCLTVSVMLYGSANLSGVRPYRDGYLTSRNTFQKYYTQTELRDFIANVLNIEPLAAGQGVFLVFRDELEEQRYLLRRQIGFKVRDLRPTPKAAPSNKNARNININEEHQKLVEDLAAEIRTLGRQPDISELPNELVARLKMSNLGLQRAAGLALAGISHAELENIVSTRTEDLSLHFAMHAFSLRKPYGSLPSELKLDIRAFFGSHKRAQDAGQALLFSIGNQEQIAEDACLAASAGKGRMEDGKFQFHISRLPELSVRLRGYVALSERLAGDLSEATLLRIHIATRKLTALVFADFDTSFLPRLVKRIKVEFDKFDVTIIDHTADNDVKLLYLKSRYMTKTDPRWTVQKMFDQEVMDLNKLDFSNEGPSFREFARTLLAAGVKIPR